MGLGQCHHTEQGLQGENTKLAGQRRKCYRGDITKGPKNMQNNHWMRKPADGLSTDKGEWSVHLVRARTFRLYATTLHQRHNSVP